MLGSFSEWITYIGWASHQLNHYFRYSDWNPMMDLQAQDRAHRIVSSDNRVLRSSCVVPDMHLELILCRDNGRQMCPSSG